MNVHATFKQSDVRYGTLTFKFEELPTIISDDGFEMAPVSGSAEIEYSTHGEPHVADIYLDAYRRKTLDELRKNALCSYVKKQIKLDQREHQTLWCAIHDQLMEGKFRSSVDSAIRDALDWED